MLTQVVKGKVVEDTRLCSCCGEKMGSKGSFSYGIKGVPRVYKCNREECSKDTFAELNALLVRCYLNIESPVTEEERTRMIEDILRRKYEDTCSDGDYGFILESLLDMSRKGFQGYENMGTEKLIGEYADILE